MRFSCTVIALYKFSRLQAGEKKTSMFSEASRRMRLQRQCIMHSSTA